MPVAGKLCPLRCGQCCDDWRDVPELLDDAAMHPNATDCPHIASRGCTLRRVDRPAACLEHLCGVAQAVSRGDIEHNEGVYLKERCQEDVPYKVRRRA